MRVLVPPNQRLRPLARASGWSERKLEEQTKIPPFVVVFLFGAPGWTRTNDLRLRSPLLYPAELPGQNYPVGSFVDSSEASLVQPPQTYKRTKLVRVGRIEPPSPAWKAGILAVIRHPHCLAL